MAVLTSLVLPPLLLVAIGSMEMASVALNRQAMQDAIDAATLGGARARALGQSDWKAQAAAIFAQSYESGAPTTAFTPDGDVTRGVATHAVPLYVAGLFANSAVDVTVSAAAVSGSGAESCILLLEETERAALLNSSGEIISTCGMQINSSGKEALFVNSGAKVAAATNVVGKVKTNSGAKIEPAATEGAPAIPDPLKDLPEPALAATCQGYNVNGGQTLTLPPGRVCGYFNLNPGGKVVLSPGVHVFSANLNVNTGATLEGDGVTIFTPSGAQVYVNSGATVDLKAPKSGAYAGVLFFQARNNSAQFIFNTGSTLKLAGTIYTPAAEVVINSNATVAPIDTDIALIARKLIVNGGSKLLVERKAGACRSEYLPAALSVMCVSAGDLRLIE